MPTESSILDKVGTKSEQSRSTISWLRRSGEEIGTVLALASFGVHNSPLFYHSRQRRAGALVRLWRKLEKGEDGADGWVLQLTVAPLGGTVLALFGFHIQFMVSTLSMTCHTYSHRLVFLDDFRIVTTLTMHDFLPVRRIGHLEFVGTPIGIGFVLKITAAKLCNFEQSLISAVPGFCPAMRGRWCSR